MKDVIIIGSGPAGLAAAVYACRAGLSVQIAEMLYPGGQMALTSEVDNYPGVPDTLGWDLAERMREHAHRLGAEFVQTQVQRIVKTGTGFEVTTDNGVLQVKSVIAAMGAQRKKLGIPGEEAFAGRGVSYCATCDGGFFRGKDVVVIGGGDAALEDAAYLSAVCRSVTLVHRRESFRADPVLVEQLKKCANVRVLAPYAPVEIIGGDRVTEVMLAQRDTGEQLRIPTDGVFVAVGNQPSTQLLQGLVTLDEAGYVPAGEDCRTECEGLFVAGDLRRKPLYQIVTAAADGAVAAKAAAEYLRG